MSKFDDLIRHEQNGNDSEMLDGVEGLAKVIAHYYVTLKANGVPAAMAQRLTFDYQVLMMSHHIQEQRD